MWKDWLALSKREQKGFVVLSIILIILIVFYSLIPLLFYTDNQDRMEADKDLECWIDSVNAINNTEIVLKSDSLFFFNPNEVTISKLQKLGVAEPALINWLKYRESGRRFKASEDILKIYLLDSTLAMNLIPYVKFNVNVMKKGKYIHSYVSNDGKEKAFKQDDRLRIINQKKNEDSFVIEINSADTAEFVVLSGIGPILSSRIILYRSALGGFIDVEQLKEVYGMPAKTIDENRNYLTVDSLAINKIDVNRVSLRRLKKHPYINFYLAKAIVEYRKENNSIKNIEAILSLKEIKPELKNKLAVYLTVEGEN